MNKINSFMLFGLVMGFVLILTLGVASANTLVAGKIYSSDYSNVISDADVSVSCGNGEGSILTTTSLSDGTYAVVFNMESCYNSNSVSILVSKNNLYGEGNAAINISQEGEFVAISNANVKIKETSTTTTTSGGGHSRYYLCGNGKCDSGETPQTCLKDCPIVIEGETSTELSNNNVGLESTSTELTDTQNTGSNSGITGAVTGTSGNRNNLIIILVFVLLLVLAMILIALVRKKNKKKEN